MNRRTVEDLLLAVWLRRGPLSALLLPLSWLYGALSGWHLRRQQSRAWRAPIPVIVVGNLFVGGTGKTPVTLAICRQLQAGGWHPGIVSRGYGLTIGPSARLADDNGGADWLGDEPALLHQESGAPVAVHPIRTRAAQALLAAHPEVDVLLADDALQHRALARDLEIVVQDSRGTGNGRLLPAGPLREPVKRLASVDWLITNLDAGTVTARVTSTTTMTPGPAPDDEAEPGPVSIPAAASPSAPAHATAIESAHDVPPRIVRTRTLTMRLLPGTVTQLTSGLQLSWPNWLNLHGQTQCTAMAGIGHPTRFFAMLEAGGQHLALRMPLADHQAISPAMLDALPDAPILITAKDAIKLTGTTDARLWTVHAQPVFSDPHWFAALECALRKAAKRLDFANSH